MGDSDDGDRHKSFQMGVSVGYCFELAVRFLLRQSLVPLLPRIKRGIRSFINRLILF